MMSQNKTWRPGKMKPTPLFICAIMLVFLATLNSGSILASDRGEVEKATFTSQVEDQAPVDFLQEISDTTPVVYYYCEVLGLPGQEVTHRWRHKAKVMQEVQIAIKSERQATWSKMDMPPESTGVWYVDVVNGQGAVIETDLFTYEAPL
jgi:hypothetical protein